MKVRVRFSKQGMMKYIGHLDVVRYFQKVNRRAGIDVAYSEGFSPHQKMSFAAPLSVGLLSKGEYFDMELNSMTSSKEMIELLNLQNVDGIEILSLKKLGDHDKNCMSIVAAADYLVHMNMSDESELPHNIIVDSDIQKYLNQPEIMVLKKTKKSEKMVDIRPMIYDMKRMPDGIFLKVAQGSASNLKPELVIKSLFEMKNIKVPNGLIYERLDMYSRIDEQLVSLGEIGENVEQ